MFQELNGIIGVRQATGQGPLGETINKYWMKSRNTLPTKVSQSVQEYDSLLRRRVCRATDLTRDDTRLRRRLGIRRSRELCSVLGYRSMKIGTTITTCCVFCDVPYSCIFLH